MFLLLSQSCCNIIFLPEFLFELSQPQSQYSDIPPQISCGPSSDSSSFLFSSILFLLVRGSQREQWLRVEKKLSSHVLSANCKKNSYCNICTIQGVTFNTRAVKQGADTASNNNDFLITSRLHFKLRPLINCTLTATLSTHQTST